MNLTAQKTIMRLSRWLLSVACVVTAFYAQAAEFQGIEEIIVTAEKRQSTVQDTAIAVSVFDSEALDARQIATTSELQFSVPNMVFSKGNFEGSNVTLRGIGNQAVADSSDNGVGIHVNDIYLNEPRIFEVEFYDIERIETLRGPQGTLYGRNTTGGVLNVITKRPSDEFEADVAVSLGDYSERKLNGMVNFALSDRIATRIAGYYLKRDGYTKNIYTGNDIDDRDLWSARWTTRFDIGENTTATFMASYLTEDDARSRTSKQLCTKDARGAFGYGCLPGSKGFSTPHSQSFITSALDGLLNANAGFAAATGGPARTALGATPGPDGAAALSWELGLKGDLTAALTGIVGDAATAAAIANAYSTLAFTGVTTDFYANSFNPADMRKVNADFDPEYYMDERLLSLEIRHDFENVTLTSITAQHEGSIEALTDFDWAVPSENYLNPVTYQINRGRTRTATFSEGIDRAQAETEQVSQQFTLVSNSDAALNWTLGLYYMNFTKDSHYNVYSSGLTAWANAGGIPSIIEAMLGLYYMNFSKDSHYNVYSSGLTAWANAGGIPSIIEAMLGLPENTIAAPLETERAQFDSYTQYEVSSWAVFGEIYYDLSDATRVTVGLRYSNEDKEVHSRQYFVDLAADYQAPLSDQNNDWQEVTGKLSVAHDFEWSFTDEAMGYATLSRGYKGGGFNPPQADVAARAFSDTFDPEYNDAFEVGLKARLMDNRLQANLALFIYDYKGLQVSQIVSQTAINENIDADIKGLEAEFAFVPNENWRFGLNLAYLNAKVGDFATIDTADPTQGGPVVNIFGNLYPAAGTDVVVDLTGNELVNSPKYSVNLLAEYSWYLAGGMALMFHVDHYYQDSYYARNFNTPADKIDSWSVSNAFVSLTNATETWTIRAWVKNWEDDDNITGFYTSDANTGLFTNAFVLEPRVYGLSFSMSVR